MNADSAADGVAVAGGAAAGGTVADRRVLGVCHVATPRWLCCDRAVSGREPNTAGNGNRTGGRRRAATPLAYCLLKATCLRKMTILLGRATILSAVRPNRAGPVLPVVFGIPEVPEVIETRDLRSSCGMMIRARRRADSKGVAVGTQRWLPAFPFANTAGAAPTGKNVAGVARAACVVSHRRRPQQPSTRL